MGSLDLEGSDLNDLNASSNGFKASKEESKKDLSQNEEIKNSNESPSAKDCQPSDENWSSNSL
jgi:hypothetical protein